jgi:TPP-dependent pyruvate/acetoin dehydrogenase alpha subunit
MNPRELARRVLEVRLWQHVINEEMKRGRFRIPIHAAFGHEALAVTLDETLGPLDQLALTHRNMAYQFARARAFAPIQQEYLLAPEGACGGRLGSMNLTQPSRGIVYTSSILGNNLPVACGLAFAHKVRRSEGVVFVLTGDGAMEEGAFYETLLFARSHQLPLAVLIENNDHSLASRISERRSPIDVSGLAGALDIPHLPLSGNDLTVYSQTLARARAAAQSGPVVIEARVRTFCNHAGATPGWATDPRHISLSDGLIVESSSEDPAYMAARLLGHEAVGFTEALIALSSHLLGIPKEEPCHSR